MIATAHPYDSSHEGRLEFAVLAELSEGPQYTGPVTVVGTDHYGLDGDGDGSACESD